MTVHVNKNFFVSPSEGPYIAIFSYFISTILFSSLQAAVYNPESLQELCVTCLKKKPLIILQENNMRFPPSHLLQALESLIMGCSARDEDLPQKLITIHAQMLPRKEYDNQKYQDHLDRLAALIPGYHYHTLLEKNLLEPTKLLSLAEKKLIQTIFKKTHFPKLSHLITTYRAIDTPI